MDDQQVIKCKICGNSEGNTSILIKEMMFGTGEAFPYSVCGTCQSIQITEIPQNLGDYYPADYYSLAGINPSSSIVRFIKSMRFRLFKWTKLDIFKHYHYGDWLEKLNMSYDQKVLDVGCGNGQLLYEFYANGYKKLTGVDPFIARDVKLNDRLSLFKKSLFELDESFDCIMMHHSFEHMAEPGEVIRKASTLLPSGGKLLIRVPVADKYAYKTYGTDWVQLDAPRHLIIPSEEALVELAKNAGFIVDKIIYDSTSFQFWGSELYKRNLSQKGTDIHAEFSKIEIREFDEMATKLNAQREGDQACFYFVKK